MAVYETSRRLTASVIERSGETVAALQAHVAFSDGSERVFATPVTNKVYAYLENHLPEMLSGFLEDWRCMGLPC